MYAYQDDYFSCTDEEILLAFQKVKQKYSHWQPNRAVLRSILARFWELKKKNVFSEAMKIALNERKVFAPEHRLPTKSFVGTFFSARSQLVRKSHAKYKKQHEFLLTTKVMRRH